MSEPRRRVYTDGACSGNPGPGGWAWISPDGPFAAGPSADTTNQRMELQAVLEATRANDGPLEVISDSTYVVNCFRDRWWEGWLRRGWVNSKKEPVANRDLWEPLIAEVRPRDIEFTWVKGHAGDEWNDLADRLAVEATFTQQPRTGSERPTEIGEPDKVKRPSVPTGKDPTGREPPEGHRLVVLGLRPRELGGYGEVEVADRLRSQLAEILAAKAEMHDDLVVLSGARLGAEMIGAQAAAEAGVPFALVLPYPDPESVWPATEREKFGVLAQAATEVITLQKKEPADKKAARGALARRDAWFARNAQEAIVVWDNEDDDVGRLVRTMQDALGELEVWVLEP
ncbi:MAG: RNase H family protein [Acidimicrobiales bacterium]